MCQGVVPAALTTPHLCRFLCVNQVVMCLVDHRRGQGLLTTVGFSWETVLFLTNWMLTGNGEGSGKSSLLHTPDSGR